MVDGLARDELRRHRERKICLPETLGLQASEYIRAGEARFYVCPFEIESIRSLPWGDELFDGFLVLGEIAVEDDSTTREIVNCLVELNNDWIETLGAAAEQVHDWIDSASAARGRQANVGDGSPMTAWHSDLTSTAGVVDYIALGGLGSCDYKLVVVVNRDRFAGLVQALKRRLGVAVGEVR